MRAKTFWRKLKYYIQFFPFTVNTLFCALAVWAGWYFLHHSPKTKKADTEETYSAIQPFVKLMASLLVWFIIGLVVLSVLSALATWLYFLIISTNDEKGLQLQFDTDASKKGRSPKLFLNAAIRGAVRPLLGFVKGRLFYDDYRLTDSFALLSNDRKRGEFLRSGIRGRNRLLLPDIKEYQLRGGFVFFEDMLRLTSFAAPQKITGQFYQPPLLRAEQDADVSPKKTETLDVRIDQMRRVEGDLLNYKDFEAGDDVRRIVWKVYARNRELVVRQPERFEPYASHLYFYASFAAPAKSAWLSDTFLKEMLNYYKNSVWTVWDALAQKEWQMRYVPDQQFNIPQNLSDADRAARIISNSEWLPGNSLREYFNASQGAVLTISSLTDVHELEEILELAGPGTVVYFVKLSKTFHHFAAMGWLRRIIFLSPQDRLSRIRSRWLFSPIRGQIRSRERAIEAALAKSNAVTAIL